jgi:hypothetical protein
MRSIFWSCAAVIVCAQVAHAQLQVSSQFVGASTFGSPGSANNFFTDFAPDPIPDRTVTIAPPDLCQWCAIATAATSLSSDVIVATTRIIVAPGEGAPIAAGGGASIAITFSLAAPTLVHVRYTSVVSLAQLPDNTVIQSLTNIATGQEVTPSGTFDPISLPAGSYRLEIINNAGNSPAAAFDAFSRTITTTIQVAGAACDSIDFNQNGIFPEDQDIVDLFNVLAGGPCSAGNSCGDIDFNNNQVFPEDQDVIDYFTVLAGGQCP